MSIYEPPEIGEVQPMKFVLLGKTFDTNTSIKVAVSRGTNELEDRSIRYENTLYRTRLGNFFAHYHSTTKFPKGKPVVEDNADTISPGDGALAWIVENDAAVLDATGIDLPSEA